MPEGGKGYGGTTITKSEPRATASVKSLDSNDYGTAKEGQSMSRMGPGGKSPSGKESSPALNGDPGFARNVKYPFDSNPDSGDAMPRRKS